MLGLHHFQHATQACSQRLDRSLPGAGDLGLAEMRTNMTSSAAMPMRAFLLPSCALLPTLSARSSIARRAGSAIHGRCDGCALLALCDCARQVVWVPRPVLPTVLRGLLARSRPHL